jgi:outer membrane protein TolC
MPRLSTFVLCVLFTLNAVAGESVSRPGVLHLNLDQAIQMALAKNFSIEVSRFEPRIARERVTSALGRFDPEFTLRRTFSENTQRDFFFDERHISRTSILQGESVSAALSGLTPLGTTYDLSLGTRLSSGTSNNFDEDFTSEATIALRQPLLRDAGPNANLAQVRIARNNLLVSEWQLRQRVIDVITETVFTFNELHLAHENLALALRSRALAEQTQKDNIRRFEIGTMSPLNITTARAEVALREEAVIVAQRLVKDNENFLKQLVTDDLEPMLAVQVEIDPPPSPAFRADVPAGPGRGFTLASRLSSGRPRSRTAEHQSLVLQKSGASAAGPDRKPQLARLRQRRRHQSRPTVSPRPDGLDRRRDFQRADSESRRTRCGERSAPFRGSGACQFAAS